MTEWVEETDRLVKVFEFKSFPAAIAFMVRASFKCEKMDHHPEWKNVYNKIFVELITHDRGGITHLDHTLAAFLDKLYGDMR